MLPRSKQNVLFRRACLCIYVLILASMSNSSRVEDDERHGQTMAWWQADRSELIKIVDVLKYSTFEDNDLPSTSGEYSDKLKEKLAQNDWSRMPSEFTVTRMLDKNKMHELYEAVHIATGKKVHVRVYNPEYQASHILFHTDLCQYVELLNLFKAPVCDRMFQPVWSLLLLTGGGDAPQEQGGKEDADDIDAMEFKFADINTRGPFLKATQLPVLVLESYGMQLSQYLHDMIRCHFNTGDPRIDVDNMAIFNQKIQAVSVQIMTCVYFLHRADRVHSNLNTRSFSLDVDPMSGHIRRFVLTGLGYVRVVEMSGFNLPVEQRIHHGLHAPFIAPEVFFSVPSGKQADIWSIGAIILTMLSAPFHILGYDNIGLSKVIMARIQNEPKCIADYYSSFDVIEIDFLIKIYGYHDWFPRYHACGYELNHSLCKKHIEWRDLADSMAMQIGPFYNGICHGSTPLSSILIPICPMSLSLISSLLAYHPYDRIPLHVALQTHPWIKDIAQMNSLLVNSITNEQLRFDIWALHVMPVALNRYSYSLNYACMLDSCLMNERVKDSESHRESEEEKQHAREDNVDLEICPWDSHLHAGSVSKKDPDDGILKIVELCVNSILDADTSSEQEEKE